MNGISKKIALERMQKYCAYQERCHSEVRHKLLSLGIYGDALEEIIFDLIQENFLNEERFARSYARGKFRIKQWGRNKIIKELKVRQVSEYCIRMALEEIDEEEYLQTLKKLARKKWSEYRGMKNFERKGRLARYLASRGFESELIWAELKNGSYE